MKNKTNKKKWNAPIVCFISFFIVILILFIQFCYLALSKNVYGINMKDFANSRNTVTNVLSAKRGTIYDDKGEILAQNISSYTLIAYLSPISKDDTDNYVKDKEYTATKLASILGEENYDYILSRLNKDSKQVEFGSVGKNITELTKLAIEDLNLPGISFVETIKRYYPNGNFAPYIIGYAKQYMRINLKVGDEYNLYSYYSNYYDNYDNIKVTIANSDILSLEDKTIKGLKKGNTPLVITSNDDILANIIVNVTEYDNYKLMDYTIVGELGVESFFEKKLQGVDGYIKYQQDKYGYKIPDTNEEKLDAVDGYDIYLTIDSNIQRFAENAVSEIKESNNPEWSIVTVMSKDGEILASATSPSYNPNNIPNNMSYQNPLVSYTYEPGSVMKIYTYMCAIETGLYDGNKTYLSGTYDFDPETSIHDWNNDGWGYLSYDTGFSYSSNVAIINIIKDYLSLKELKSCFEKYGFNKKTNIELSNEEKGALNFKYEVDLMSAGFGQGISTTAIQQLQALSIIANNGVMVKPHIIQRMVNTSTKEEITTEIVKSNKLASDSTIIKIKDLMQSVISPDSPTGKKYYIENYDLIGKTGTAQIYGNGKYLMGENDYIVSVALMFPKENPEIIIYAAAKKPQIDANNTLQGPIKNLVVNISKYKGMYSNTKPETITTKYELEKYISKNTNDVVKGLELNGIKAIVIGSGDRIINQYPKEKTNIIKGEKVFLITNKVDYKMINLKNWSRNEVQTYCNFVSIDCDFEGNGYVTNQSIGENTQLTKDMKLKVTLENKQK